MSGGQKNLINEEIESGGKLHPQLWVKFRTRTRRVSKKWVKNKWIRFGIDL
jgi:hypothetical protein